MAKSTTIKLSEEQKELLSQRVETFNKTNKTNYIVVFRGKFCYISKIDKKVAFLGIFGGGSVIETNIGRLALTSENDINKMEFAVFKYSSETYDANEFFFPGAGKLDGTIEGALRAGFELYP